MDLVIGILEIDLAGMGLIDSFDAATRSIEIHGAHRFLLGAGRVVRSLSIGAKVMLHQRQAKVIFSQINAASCHTRHNEKKFVQDACRRFTACFNFTRCTIPLLTWHCCRVPAPRVHERFHFRGARRWSAQVRCRRRLLETHLSRKGASTEAPRTFASAYHGPSI